MSCYSMKRFAEMQIGDIHGTIFFYNPVLQTQFWWLLLERTISTSDIPNSFATSFSYKTTVQRLPRQQGKLEDFSSEAIMYKNAAVNYKIQTVTEDRALEYKIMQLFSVNCEINCLHSRYYTTDLYISIFTFMFFLIFYIYCQL